MIVKPSANQINNAKELAKRVGAYDRYDWLNIEKTATANDVNDIIKKLLELKNNK